MSGASGGHGALVSAHATHGPGIPGRDLSAFQDAAATGADYVELDIRRTADGELVAFHDALAAPGRPLSVVKYDELCDLAGYPVPRVADVLAVIAGHARGHLDLKVPGDEERLVRLALDALGPGGFVITTPDDVSVAIIRSRYPDAAAVPLALTLGRDLAGATRAAWLRTRRTEVWPLPRVRASGASWVAAEHRLAALGVVRQCRRERVRTMVWTVNDEREMRYWLTHGRIDMLVTDRPDLALALRDGTALRPAACLPGRARQ